MSAFRLRPEQQRVIDEYRGGYAAISAVPGAGKTTTLSSLAASLIARRVIGPHQRVMIVTYQNAAVANFQAAMRRRLAEQGRNPDRGYAVRTLHGLANDVLRLARHRVRLDLEARVADETETSGIRKSAAQAQIERLRDTPGFSITGNPDSDRRLWSDEWIVERVINDATGAFRGQAIDYARLEAKLGARHRWAALAIGTGEAYQRELRAAGWLDYDGLIVAAVRALENDPSLCAQLRRRWPFLLEDEAQDSSPLQEKMLTLIAGERGNLVRVGDANQAILTTFTDSDVEGFRRWISGPDVQRFELRGSSRSTPAIIDLANAFLRWSRVDFPIEAVRASALDDRLITAIDGENPTLPNRSTLGLAVRKFDATISEQNEVIDRALGHLRKHPEDRVAILTGSKNSGYIYVQTALARGFDDARIIRLLGPKDGRPVPIIDRLTPLLKFLANPVNGGKLVRALSAWSQDDVDDRVLNEVRRRNDPASLDTLLFPATPEDESGWIPDDLTPEEEQTLRRLRAVPRWLEQRLSPPHELLALIAATIEPDEETERGLLNTIVVSLSTSELSDEYDNLKQLEKYLEDLKLERRHLRGTPEQHAIEIAPGTLTVATRHQAKGLEWDVVFAVECDNFWFPGDLNIQRPTHREYMGEFDPLIVAKTEIKRLLEGDGSPPTDDELREAMYRDALENISEKLRIMYVTLTRARRAVWLSWHEQGRDQRIQSPLLPAIEQYMEEIRRALAS